MKAKLRLRRLGFGIFFLQYLLGELIFEFHLGKENIGNISNKVLLAFYAAITFSNVLNVQYGSSYAYLVSSKFHLIKHQKCQEFVEPNCNWPFSQIFVTYTHLIKSGLAAFTHWIKAILVKTSWGGDWGIVVQPFSAVHGPVVIAEIVHGTVASTINEAVLANLFIQGAIYALNEMGH